jgi:glycosyltransferase involved in cell wall biosynthesis
MGTRITVCIVTYNQGEMLREAIQSVLNQTYKDIKIIVLDDASSDNTPDIAASFDDTRLRYVRHEKNIGAVNNWNYAIDFADTEYVNVFHGDDHMFPWMIEKLVAVLDQNKNIGFVASARNFSMGSKKFPSKRKTTVGKNYRTLEYAKEYAKSGDYSILAPSIVIRKKIFDIMGIRYRSDAGPAADTYFVLEANSKGIEMFLIDEPLLEYRQHENNWTNKSGFDTWFDSLCRVEDLTRNIIPEVNMSLWRTNYTKWLFMTTSAYALSNTDLTDDFSRKRDITEERGWHISDAEFLESILFNALKQIESSVLLQETKEKVRQIFAEHRWEFSEHVFDQSMLRYHVREFIKKIGEGTKTFAEYRKMRADLIKAGFKIPLVREILWFLEYAPLIGYF